MLIDHARLERKVNHIRQQIKALRVVRGKPTASFMVVNGGNLGSDVIAFHNERIGLLRWIQTAEEEQLRKRFLQLSLRALPATQRLAQGDDLNGLDSDIVVAQALYELIRDHVTFDVEVHA